MLIQSYQGFVEIMPAIPANWMEASFNNFRTEGAFLISANKMNGKINVVSIFSEKGGLLKLKNPFNHYTYQADKNTRLISTNKQFINIQFKPGSKIRLHSN